MPAARVIAVVLAAAMSLFVAGAAHAAGLGAPAGPVILTVDGEIGATNTAQGADFDLAMIEALPQVTVKTSSPWTEGVSTFVGPRLADILAAVGAKGTMLKAIALNDYAVDIPASDATSNGPIAAYKLNGSYMSVRDKGPLWIIYPMDERPELKTELIYSRSIWQLRKITVSP